MKTTWPSTVRFGLFCATALASAFVIAGTAQAQSGGAMTFGDAAGAYGIAPGFDEHIVANHTVTPGPGSPATGAKLCEFAAGAGLCRRD